MQTFHRDLTMHELQRRRLAVTAVERVAPDMVRVTLAGDDLAGFVADGPADHVKLLFPHPSTGLIELPGGDNPATLLMRDFTPLARETADGLVLDLDFYTHADPGPASSWATAAKPGDEIVVAGPRGSRGMPYGVGSYLVIADETAMPSAARWIAGAQDGARITLIASVTGDGSWVSDYVGAEARDVDLRIVANDADAILAAVPEVEADTFVWAGGNAAVLLPVRRHFRRTLGLPKQQVAVDGYWRNGVVAWDHHAPVDPSDPDD